MVFLSLLYRENRLSFNLYPTVWFANGKRMFWNRASIGEGWGGNVPGPIYSPTKRSRIRISVESVTDQIYIIFTIASPLYKKSLHSDLIL